MPDDLLATAVAALLRRAPDSWTDAPAEQDALAVLTAAGFIERRITFTVRLPGEDQAQRITIEAAGEAGLAEAMEAVVADLWARYGRRWESLRRDIGTPVKPIITQESDAWRLSEQGRLARADLECGESRPIDFALNRGFFGGQPRLLPDGRMVRREPVRGHGRLVSIENASSGPLAIDVAKFSAAPEIAQALASALSSALAAVIPLVNATPPKADPAGEHVAAADVFVLERSGDGWRVEAFGEKGHFQDLRGLRYIAKLLQRPNVPIPVKLLVRDESAMPARHATVDCGELDEDGHSVQPIADKEALEAYRRRLKELDADIAEADRAGCAADAEELQREREALMDTIQEAHGLGGKQRAFGNDGDKLRPSVHAALGRVYQRMREAKPAMARTAEHLELSIVCEDNAFIYRGVSLPNWRIVS
jgi:hypothetical protein